MTAAISMAKELGVRKVAVPGRNAAGAMAAMQHDGKNIFMPADTPRAKISNASNRANDAMG